MVDVYSESHEFSNKFFLFSFSNLLFCKINFFYFFVISRNTETLIKSNFWLGMYVAYVLKGRLNTDTSPQNFWTTFLENDLSEKLQKSAVASAIAIPLPLCFSCFVPLRRFRENLTKPFYFYLSVLSRRYFVSN